MADKVRYFAEFTIEGKRITTYVADGMPYRAQDILERHPEAVEISPEDQQLYMQGYVRGLDGRPHEMVVTEEDFEKKKEQKREEIISLARSKLIASDHEIVEYLELHNLSDKEYTLLKQQRQAIRDYRDAVLSQLDTCTNVEMIDAIQFLI